MEIDSIAVQPSHCVYQFRNLPKIEIDFKRDNCTSKVCMQHYFYPLIDPVTRGEEMKNHLISVVCINMTNLEGEKRDTLGRKKRGTRGFKSTHSATYNFMYRMLSRMIKSSVGSTNKVWLGSNQQFAE